MGRLICTLIVAGVVVVLAATSVFVHARVHDFAVLIYWWIGNVALLFCMWAFVKGRRFTHLPVASGRILAIVPAHDEDPEELAACIWSILNQTVPPTEVHVVDDGSEIRPVQSFYHPNVFWHYKKNGGKRSAQVYALQQLKADDWDYVLTVDGDSVLELDAVEQQMRAFSNPKIMATTGMVLVRNMRHNLLTKLADINIGTSCVMMRASRSLLGTLETTSGALAMYRAHILFNNIDRYLKSGTYGDDRCLAMYSAMEGEVVGVNEAIVWSSMPTTRKQTYKQRERWSKSWWCMIPFVLTNMQQFRQIFFPIFGLIQLAIAPITMGYLVWATVMNLAHGTINWLPLMVYVGVYMAARYGATALYLVERPGMARFEKFKTWLFVTPVEAGYNLVFLNPTKYIALWRLGDHSWGTHAGGDHAHAMGGHRKVGRPAWANGFLIVAACIYGFAIISTVALNGNDKKLPPNTTSILAQIPGSLIDAVPRKPWAPDPTPTPTPVKIDVTQAPMPTREAVRKAPERPQEARTTPTTDRTTPTPRPRPSSPSARPLPQPTRSPSTPPVIIDPGTGGEEPSEEPSIPSAEPSLPVEEPSSPADAGEQVGEAIEDIVGEVESDEQAVGVQEAEFF